MSVESGGVSGDGRLGRVHKLMGCSQWRGRDGWSNIPEKRRREGIQRMGSIFQ